MSSIAKILEENPHLQPVFDELSAEEKTQLDVYLAEPRMAEGFGTHATRLGRALLESNKQRSLENKLSFARSMIHAILTDPEHRRIITSWKSLMPENEPEPFNATGSPVRVAKGVKAPPELERLPAYMMPKPAVRQRGPPQLNFLNGSNNGNGNGNGEPNRKKPKSGNRKSKRKSKSKSKTRKN